MPENTAEDNSTGEDKPILTYEYVFAIESGVLVLSLVTVGYNIIPITGSAFFNWFFLTLAYVLYNFVEKDYRENGFPDYTVQLWWILIAMIDLIVCFICVRLQSDIFIVNIIMTAIQCFCYPNVIEYESISELYFHTLVNVLSLSMFLFFHKNTFLMWWFIWKLTINLSCYLYVLFYTFPIKIFNEYRSMYDENTVPTIKITGNHTSNHSVVSTSQWKRKIDSSETPVSVMKTIPKDVLLSIMTRGRGHCKYFDIFTCVPDIPIDILSNLPYKLLKRINDMNGYSILERLVFSTENRTLSEHISDYLLRNITRSSRLFFRMSYRDLYPKRIAWCSIPPVRISPFVDLTNHDWATLKLTKDAIPPEKTELMNRKLVRWWMMI